MKYLLLLPVLFLSIYVSAGVGGVVKPGGDVYIISIGINKNSSPYELKNAVNDARAIIEKAKVDAAENIYSYLLIDEQATLANIRDAFKKVILSAKPHDHFIFYYAGVSIEQEFTQTFLIPYSTDAVDLRNLKPGQFIPLSEVAKLMEQVQCKNQLIISEAGDGNSFAQNLVAELFEFNPLISLGSDRNRIIITTKSIGFDFGDCGNGKTSHGPLTQYILDNGNLLNVFKDPLAYELDLVKAEVACPVGKRKYFTLYRENDFRNISLKFYKKTNSRGIEMEKEPEQSRPVGEDSKIFALMVAGNEYMPASGWNNLKNALDDADAVADILEKKYSVEIHKYYNKPKDSVLLKILQVKALMDTNDRFIFFIAGHGYYSKDFSDGYLVFNNSRSPEEDLTLESYLQMATLNRLLDGMPAKNVFAIFDVCFGATFDPNSKDLALSNYHGNKIDISLEEFIQRKNENYSRIFLASGRYEVPDYWPTSLAHSPFAAKLINALEREENFISPGKLYSQLEGNATMPYLKQFGRHEERSDFLLKVKL